MSFKEQVKHAIEELSEEDLREVAQYVAFLKFRMRRCPGPTADLGELAAIYEACAEEDRQVAEQGMEDYARGLRAEDKA